MKSIYIKQMVCIKCNNIMLLDDIDNNFKGNQNEYYICENCGYSCTVKIRYGKHIKTEWSRNASCHN